jgi:UDP-N-acetylglucosamine 1-carboxyvinyltransferase
MSRLFIEGGHKLQGSITTSGNKNAALKLLPACLLTDQPCILHNIPDIDDVRTTIAIMRDLGVSVNNIGPGSWRIEARNIKSIALNRDLASHIRASFVFSGPMLSRMGKITLPGPGGDLIGGRPLDTNIQGLQALGARIEIDNQGTFTIIHWAQKLKESEAAVYQSKESIDLMVASSGWAAILWKLAALLGLRL